MCMVSILVNIDIYTTATSDSIPSSTVSSSIATATTELSTTYSATTTSNIETIHTSSISTKTTSSITFTTRSNNIPTTAPTVQNITSQITEVSQSTTFENHVAQNTIDGLLGSFSQTNSEDINPYIRFFLATTYNIKWVNLVYGDQSADYRKMDIYVGFNTNSYLDNTFCTSTSSSRKSKFDTFTCSHAGKIGNVIFITSQAGFSGLIRIYEFEVFATTAFGENSQPQDITSRGIPFQSSTNRLFRAEKAVDSILESYCETIISDPKPYFLLSFDSKHKVAYLDITYGSTNDAFNILKFYVGNIVSNPSGNTYCNSTANQLSLNWETVTCENGGIEGKKLFITSEGIIKVKEMKVYGFSL